MKRTEENLKVLEALGFKNTDDDWFQLPNGWCFRLDTIKDFPTLFERYKESHCEECEMVDNLKGKIEELEGEIEELKEELEYQENRIRRI